MGSAVRAGEAFVEILAKDGLDAGLRSAQRKLESFGASAMSIGSKLLAVGGLGAAGLGFSTNEFAQFEKQMANVSTLLDQPALHMKGFSADVQRLSIAFGEGTDTISKGLYDLISASIAPDKAIGVLTMSMKAAKAGMTDTATSVATFVNVLNAFQIPADRASEAADTMFLTIKRGVTTFPELAQFLGSITATANAAGLSFDDVGAAMATMTRNGLKTDIAVTGLQNILSEFLKPTDEGARIARQFGVDLSVAGLKAQGFSNVIEKLGTLPPDVLAKIFPDVRGLRGMLALRNDLQGFKTDVATMQNKAGAAQAAYDKVANLASTALGAAWQGVKLLAVAVGEQLAPAFVAVARVVAIAGYTLGEWIKNNGRFVLIAAAAVGVVLTLGGAFVAVGFAAIIASNALAGVVGLVAAFRALSGANALLSLSSALASAGMAALSLAGSLALVVARASSGLIAAAARSIVALGAAMLSAAARGAVALGGALVSLAGSLLSLAWAGTKAAFVFLYDLSIGLLSFSEKTLAAASMAIVGLIVSLGRLTLAAVRAAVIGIASLGRSLLVLGAGAALSSIRLIGGALLSLGSAAISAATATVSSFGAIAIGNPFALIAAGAVAAGAAWLVFSGKGSQAVSIVREGFGEIASTAVSTVKAASDAMLSGDMESASAIAIAGVGLIWAQGLQTVGKFFGEGVNVWLRLIAAGKWSDAAGLAWLAIAAEFEVGSKRVSLFFSEVATGWRMMFDSAATSIRSVWGDAIAWIAGKLVNVMRLLGYSKADVESMQASLAADNEGAKKALAGDLEKRQAERGAALLAEQKAADAEIAAKRAEFAKAVALIAADAPNWETTIGNAKDALDKAIADSEAKKAANSAAQQAAAAAAQQAGAGGQPGAPTTGTSFGSFSSAAVGAMFGGGASTPPLLIAARQQLDTLESIDRRLETMEKLEALNYG